MKTKTSEFSWSAFLYRNIYILSAVLVILIFFIINPSFLSLYSIQNVTREMAPLLPLACGIGFVLYAGCIDLSIGAVTSAVCVITGLYVTKLGQWIIPLMLLFGVFIGLVNGTLVSRVKLPSFIVTLCAQSVYRAVAIVLSGGGSQNIGLKERHFVNWASNIVLGLPLMFWISILIVLFCVVIERNTALGKSIFSIGANERSARLAGVNTAWVKTMAFVLCSVGATVGGMMYAYKLKSSVPAIGDDKYMMAISAVALGGTLFSGGRGSALRTLVGVITVISISSGMNMAGVDPLWSNVVFGIVLIAAVAINSEKGVRDLIIK